MTLLAGAVIVLALVVVVLLVLVVRLSRAVRDLAPAPEPAPEVSATPMSVVSVPQADAVITTLGQREDEPVVVSNQVVLSATFGEPLLKVVAFGHGVRRALSPEVRNRIRFEVRRETKRARKDRKREMREAWRQMRREDVA